MNAHTETFVPSRMFPLVGEAPEDPSAEALLHGLGAFDGLFNPRFLTMIDQTHGPTFWAVLHNIHEASKLARDDDRERLLDVGPYPHQSAPTDAARVTVDSFSRVPYGNTLLTTSIPYIGPSGILVRGCDSNRLRSVTMFTLRQFCSTGDTVTPLGHIEVGYEPTTHPEVWTSGYEPCIFADRNLYPDGGAEVYRVMNGVLWLIENHKARQGSKAKGSKAKAEYGGEIPQHETRRAPKGSEG